MKQSQQQLKQKKKQQPEQQKEVRTHKVKSQVQKQEIKKSEQQQRDECNLLLNDSEIDMSLGLIESGFEKLKWAIEKLNNEQPSNRENVTIDASRLLNAEALRQLSKDEIVSARSLLEKCRDQIVIDPMLSQSNEIKMIRGVTLCNIGVCLRRQGKLSKSLDSLMEALHITSQQPDRSHLKNIYLNLAVLNSQLGLHDRAVNFGEKALNEAQKENRKNEKQSHQTQDKLKQKEVDEILASIDDNIGIGSTPKEKQIANEVLCHRTIAVDQEYLGAIQKAQNHLVDAVQLAESNLGENHPVSKVAKEEYQQLLERIQRETDLGTPKSYQSFRRKVNDFETESFGDNNNQFEEDEQSNQQDPFDRIRNKIKKNREFLTNKGDESLENEPEKDDDAKFFDMPEHHQNPQKKSVTNKITEKSDENQSGRYDSSDRVSKQQEQKSKKETPKISPKQQLSYQISSRNLQNEDPLGPRSRLAINTPPPGTPIASREGTPPDAEEKDKKKTFSLEKERKDSEKGEEESDRFMPTTTQKRTQNPKVEQLEQQKGDFDDLFNQDGESDGLSKNYPNFGPRLSKQFDSKLADDYPADDHRGLLHDENPVIDVKSVQNQNRIPSSQRHPKYSDKSSKQPSLIRDLSKVSQISNSQTKIDKSTPEKQTTKKPSFKKNPKKTKQPDTSNAKPSNEPKISQTSESGKPKTPAETQKQNKKQQQKSQPKPESETPEKERLKEQELENNANQPQKVIEATAQIIPLNHSESATQDNENRIGNGGDDQPFANVPHSTLPQQSKLHLNDSRNRLLTDDESSNRRPTLSQRDQHPDEVQPSFLDSRFFNPPENGSPQEKQDNNSLHTSDHSKNPQSKSSNVPAAHGDYPVFINNDSNQQYLIEDYPNDQRPSAVPFSKKSSQRTEQQPSAIPISRKQSQQSEQEPKSIIPISRKHSSKDEKQAGVLPNSRKQSDEDPIQIFNAEEQVEPSLSNRESQNSYPEQEQLNNIPMNSDIRNSRLNLNPRSTNMLKNSAGNATNQDNNNSKQVPQPSRDQVNDLSQSPLNTPQKLNKNATTGQLSNEKGRKSPPQKANDSPIAEANKRNENSQKKNRNPNFENSNNKNNNNKNPGDEDIPTPGEDFNFITPNPINPSSGSKQKVNKIEPERIPDWEEVGRNGQLINDPSLPRFFLQEISVKRFKRMTGFSSIKQNQ